MGATSESSWSGAIFVGGAWAFAGAAGLCAWNDGSSARVSPGTIATMQTTAIKCPNLAVNVSRTGLMTHFPSGAQCCGCQGAYSRKRGNKTRETPTSSCDECAAHSQGHERNGNRCFKESHCRLLVILLVASSLRISEY